MEPTRTPDGARGTGTRPPAYHTRGWNAGRPVPPDLRQTESFLRFLDPQATHHAFRLIHDRDRSRSARKLYGTLREHADELTRANAEGFGVFAVVNATDGQGQSAANVTRVRAAFVDGDGAPLPDPGDFPADAIIWSSPPRNGQHARWHAYLRTDPRTVVPGLFRAIQLGLARTFGGDESISDTPRVMRVPGFTHGKAQPYQTTAWWLDHDSPPWTLAQIVHQFPLVGAELQAQEQKRAEAQQRATERTTNPTPPSADAFHRAFAAWFRRKAATIHGQGRHQLLVDAARHALDNSIPRGEAERLLLSARDDLPPRPDGSLPDDAEVREVITWAWENLTPGAPWDLTRDEPASVIRNETTHAKPPAADPWATPSPWTDSAPWGNTRDPWRDDRAPWDVKR